MRCESVKPGIDCTFMTKKGCSFNGGKCHEIVESCNGCDRTVGHNGGTYCVSFPEPAIKWRRGACNLATHVKSEKSQASMVKLNPLKASKRAAAGR